MDFDLPKEVQDLQDSAIRFARANLQDDHLVQRDHDEVFWREGWNQCASFGVQGLPIPEAYGGSGQSMTAAIAVMEGLGYVCRDRGLLFSINAHLWTNSIPILKYGTEEQKLKYLPGLSNGKLVGANAVSEPEAGSDAFGMRTIAVKDGDEYVLNGDKTFVTNAGVGDLYVAYATINPKLGPMGITGFIIERGTPGLMVGQKIEKMGLRTSPMSQVAFQDCRVPVTARLGREGRGGEVFNCSMEWERSCILASCLGGMKRQLEECVKYARTRKQFGKAIGKFQSVANRIVDMKMRLETARPLIYKVGWLHAQGKSAEMEAAMAKLYVSEACVQSSLDAITTHGGYGFATDYQFERELRDSIGGRIYSGTSDIQRNIIARGLGL
jgi:alkylation response protein AidB-like acyl-CoA dehydrogenase